MVDAVGEVVSWEGFDEGRHRARLFSHWYLWGVGSFSALLSRDLMVFDGIMMRREEDECGRSGEEAVGGGGGSWVG